MLYLQSKLAVIFSSKTFSIEIGVESEPDCILTLNAIPFLSLNKCCTFCMYFCIEMWDFEFKTCLVWRRMPTVPALVRQRKEDRYRSEMSPFCTGSGWLAKAMYPQENKAKQTLHRLFKMHTQNTSHSTYIPVCRHALLSEECID